MMETCFLCPRRCGANRGGGETGVCGMPDVLTAAAAFPHFWEEPCISGAGGSGAVFFSGCPLGCVFCQNAKISRGRFGKALSPEELMRVFDDLLEQGVHNLNLVSPTPYAGILAHVLEQYRSPVPVIYNCGGYERVETLKRLEGLIDIWLPDIKFFDSAVSAKYAGAPDYFEAASAAVLEMQRQRGTLVLGEDGLAKEGLLIRHLVLPGNLSQTGKILGWISENLPRETAVSLMSQYTPCGASELGLPLSRKLSAREYQKAKEMFGRFGFFNGYMQDPSSAGRECVPAFRLEGLEEISKTRRTPCRK